jgi:hypothetical protein
MGYSIVAGVIEHFLEATFPLHPADGLNLVSKEIVFEYPGFSV